LTANENRVTAVPPYLTPLQDTRHEELNRQMPLKAEWLVEIELEKSGQCDKPLEAIAP